MSDAEEAKITVVGTTMKPGRFVEESARLTWTTQKPPAPGLYWYRKSPGGRIYIVAVELDGHTLTVDDKNTDQCRGPVATCEGQWAGPLLSPR